MTTAEFRRLALSLPGSTEASHMEHPDFRVSGRIFATLGCPERGWAMVVLPRARQEEFLENAPETFSKVKGGWGARGATQVRLRVARVSQVRAALRAAWENRASKTLPVPPAGSDVRRGSERPIC